MENIIAFPFSETFLKISLFALHILCLVEKEHQISVFFVSLTEFSMLIYILAVLLNLTSTYSAASKANTSFKILASVVQTAKIKDYYDCYEHKFFLLSLLKMSVESIFLWSFRTFITPNVLPVFNKFVSSRLSSSSTFIAPCVKLLRLHCEQSMNSQKILQRLRRYEQLQLVLWLHRWR